MSFILDSSDVYVISHIHNNKILRMEVFADYDQAKDKLHEWKNEGIEGDITMSKCCIDTRSWRRHDY